MLAITSALILNMVVGGNHKKKIYHEKIFFTKHKVAKNLLTFISSFVFK